MYGRPWSSTATESPNPTSSIESGTVGMNSRPSGSFTSGSGRELHATAVRMITQADVASRPRVARCPDTSGRIVASTVKAPGGSRGRAGADRQDPENLFEEAAGVRAGAGGDGLGRPLGDDLPALIATLGTQIDQ